MSTAEDFIKKFINSISSVSPNHLFEIEQKLSIALNDYELYKKESSLIPSENNTTSKAIKMFFVTKQVEGCSGKTLQYYKIIIRNFFKTVIKSIENITVDDIRYYIAMRAIHGKISKVSQDNERRILKSFFSWCTAEEYITKDPTINMKAIKHERRIKKPFTEIEIEKMRQVCENKRDLAIIDMLYSTGVRVSELTNINLSDINDDEIIVFGKGSKERVVYINARAKLSIDEYLSNRVDDGDALFISLKKPYTRLSTGGIETIVRKIGKKAGVENAHPHRFRRTAATLALNRGMPIEQVSQMLGHSKIETTTIYARSEQENVKASHKKYVV